MTKNVIEKCWLTLGGKKELYDSYFFLITFDYKNNCMISGVSVNTCILDLE
jgi:hypothetical protein